MNSIIFFDVKSYYNQKGLHIGLYRQFTVIRKIYCVVQLIKCFIEIFTTMLFYDEKFSFMFCGKA